MVRIFLYLFLVLYSSNSYAFFDKVQEVFFGSDKTITAFNSKEGKRRLLRSNHDNDFYQLVNFYQPQINPLLCSAASSVTILNALNYGQIKSQPSGEVTKPSELGGNVIPYKLYNQKDFFNDRTNKIKDFSIINLATKNHQEKYDAGLSLSDLAAILSQAYKLKVKKIHALKSDFESIDEFRDAVKRHLADKTHFILVNFQGKELGLKVGGHISPLAAYDRKTDSVLVLDVAAHKGLWYFVSLPKLYEAMHTKDGNQYRGYLVVSK